MHSTLDFCLRPASQNVKVRPYCLNVHTVPIGLHSSSTRRHEFIFTKNLTIYPLLKEDSNETFKCVLTKKNPNGTKESSPVSKTIRYIRGLENEPFFGEVKFHGSPELNLPGSRYIGKTKF